MKKIKLCYIISSLEKAGPVQVLFDIVSNIDHSQFDVLIITLKNEHKNSLYENFEKLGIKLITLSPRKNWNIYHLHKEIKPVLLSNEIDLIHGHCIRSLILSFLLRRHVKTCFTIHNNPLKQSIALFGPVGGRFISMITKYMIKKMNSPIACSNAVAGILKKELKTNIYAIPNGITPVLPNISKLEIRKILNLESNAKYFISIGRFSQEKNFELLVHAFLGAKLTNCKLIILGEGNTFERIRDISDENIILPGFQHDPNIYIQAADYYISTSLTEGMPLSVLEAMSNGLPVALSRIDAHLEIFQNAIDSPIGILFSPLSVSDISNAIITICNSDYSLLASNVRNLFEQYYTAKRMSKEYQELYKSI